MKGHYLWANLVKVANTGAETLNLLADLPWPIVYLWAHHSASVPIFILCLHTLFRLKNLRGKNFPTVFAKGIWSHLGPQGIAEIKIIGIIAFKIGKGKNISLLWETKLLYYIRRFFFFFPGHQKAFFLLIKSLHIPSLSEEGRECSLCCHMINQSPQNVQNWGSGIFYSLGVLFRHSEVYIFHL